MATNSLGAKTGNPVLLPTEWPDTSFAPSYGNITATYSINRGVWSRILNRMKGSVVTTLNTVSAIGGIYTVTIPGGYQIDNALEPTSQEGMVGKITIWDASGSYIESFGSVHVNNATSLKFKMHGQTSFNNNTAPITLATGDIIMFTFDIPIDGWQLTAYTVYGAGWARGDRPGLVQQTPQTAITVTCAQAGFSVVRSVGVAYTDINGVWRLRANVSANFTSAAVTGFTLAFTGVTFKNGIDQVANGALGNSSVVPRALVNNNSSTVSFLMASTTCNGCYLSFDVELESKPTWA